MKNIKEDFTGRKFNRLTILKDGEPFLEGGKKKRRTVVCRCDCGQEKTILLKSVKTGRTKSCGGCKENLMGKQNGFLRVIEDLGSNGNNNRLLKVECGNCGGTKEMVTAIFNKRTHCGCIKNVYEKKPMKPLELPFVRGIYTITKEIERCEDTRKRKVKVCCNNCGYSFDRIYPFKQLSKACVKCAREKTAEEKETQRIKNKIKLVYTNMKQRIYNKNSPDYHNYGGRGIKIEVWKTPTEFYNWAIQNGYEEGLELDRKDNNGNYSPNNCRWVTRSINQRNKRVVVLTEDVVREIRHGKYKGMSSKQISNIINVNNSTIDCVIKGKSWKDV